LHYDKNNLINYIITLYAFIIPISASDPKKLTLLLLLLWVLDINIYSKITKLFESRVFIALFLFLSYSVLSLLWANNLSSGFNFLTHYWYLLAFPIFITELKLHNIPKILSAFLLGMFISELISYGVMFEFFTFKKATPLNPSPFMHHTFYGLFLAFTSLLLLNKIFTTIQIKDRLLYFLFFLTVTANLFMNAGRTGYLAFSIGFITISFLYIKNKVSAFFFILLFIGTISTISYNFSSVFNARIHQAQAELTKIYENSATKFHGSFGLRLTVWSVGIEMIQENPLLGTGVGNEMIALKEKLENDPLKKKLIYNIHHFHNDYISYFVQLGIFGFLLYLNIFYQLFKLSISDKEISTLRYLFIIIFLISSLVDFVFVHKFTLALFVLFSAIFTVKSIKKPYPQPL